MQSKKVLIVFVKNILLGKVKTRLAKTVGDVVAFEVYKRLVQITENATAKLKDCDLHIYYSDTIIENKWPQAQHFVQEGEDLGLRMKNAFQHAFNQGYTKVIGIGSDLPDISTKIIQDGFNALDRSDTVFGPATDGGYYLIGMNQMQDYLFENKSWSTEHVLKQSIRDLEERALSHTFIHTLNDIDTIEDLINSSLANEFEELHELFRSNK